MRAILAVLLVWPLCGCVTDGAATQTVGKWSITRKNDPISGGPASRVFIASQSVQSRSGLAGNSIVQLMCFEGHPVVRFAYEYKVGANTSAGLEYRFDQTPGGKVNARILQDSKIVVIEDRAAVVEFLRKLGTSSVLFVRVSSLAYGTTDAEYQTPGAADAIAAAYGECPIEAAGAVTAAH